MENEGSNGVLLAHILTATESWWQQECKDSTVDESNTHLAETPCMLLYQAVMLA